MNIEETRMLCSKANVEFSCNSRYKNKVMFMCLNTSYRAMLICTAVYCLCIPRSRNLPRFANICQDLPRPVPRLFQDFSADRGVPGREVAMASPLITSKLLLAHTVTQGHCVGPFDGPSHTR
jgi:hypothetical protein